jgi:hypothetical protein
MSSDATKFILNTDYDSLKNDSVVTTSLSIAGQSFTAGQYKSFTKTFTIPDGFNPRQIRLNYSFASSNWYIFPHADLTISASVGLAVVGSASGSTFTLTFYLYNTTGGATSSSAITVNISAYTFLAPFS